MECDRCVYKNFPRLQAPTPKLSKLVIVGEAPGNEEIARKKLMIGKSGQLLQRALEACGLPSEDVFMTNAMLCRPPKGKPIKKEAVDCCRARLLEEVKAAQPELVLALGNTAMHALTNNYKLKITTEQGRVLTDTLLPGVNVVPVFNPAKILRTPGDYKTFRSALLYASSLLKGGGVLDPGETKYQVVSDSSKMAAVAAFLSKQDFVVADIETTDLSPYFGEMLVLGIAFEKNKALVIAEEALSELHQLFALPNLKWGWHNGKFDITFLRHAGLPAKVDHDTLLLHYCTNETKGTHDLEQLSAQLLGAQAYKAEMNAHTHSKKGLAGAPKEVVYRRVATDVDYTFQVFEKLLPKVENNPQLKKLYYNLLLPASGFLQRVEAHGFEIDLSAMSELEEQYSNRFQEVQEEIKKMVDDLWNSDLYVQQTGSKSKPKEFQPTSTKQLGWLFYDCLHLPTLPKKGRSTDKEVLLVFQQEPRVSKLIDKLLEMRAVQKDLSTYVRGIKTRLDPTGKIHSSFLLHGTGTGRLSSRNPNLQNISKKRKDVRRMFVAPKGYTLVEADYKGAELRVLAHMSGDMFLGHVFKEGRDLHDEVAIHFFGPNFTESHRMQAKTINFGIPYGRSEYSIADEFGISVEEARALIHAWFERAPQAAEFLQSCEDGALRGEPLVTPFGRHRRFGLITPEVVKEIANEARNFKIQSIASDLTLISAIELEPILEEKGVHIINLVHDSILCEVPDNKETILWVAQRLREVMGNIPKKYLNSTIPFEVDIGAGHSWDKVAKEEILNESIR